MHIYTSYFARLKSLPKTVVPIAICLYPPDWYTGLCYKLLAPTPSTFLQFKRTANRQRFEENFYDGTLRCLDPQGVRETLSELSNGQDVALLCYGKSTAFCHRHLVAEWFRSNGIECTEFIV